MPTPSFEPIVSPANVVTTPFGVIKRILALPASETYAFPNVSTAIPRITLNIAFVPTPFAKPRVLVPPARVVHEDEATSAHVLVATHGASVIDAIEEEPEEVEPPEHAEEDAAPTIMEGDEAGQGIGENEPRGQYEPAGQMIMSVGFEQK